ncbi:MAG: hypothetical protein Q4E13_03335 [Clostridia bacterium]|nr:hypothetical protein [Clostridia bacterium]
MNTFGEVLSQILTSHDVSISALSRQLGLKSRTTLFRVARDETSYETAVRFRDRLVQAQVIRFTECELSRMAEALEVKRLNDDVYRANRAMEQLLREEKSVGAPLRVSGIPGISTFDELARRYAEGRDVRIRMVGLCDRRITAALHDALTQTQQNFDIRHHIFHVHDAADTIRHLDALLPILFSRGYTAQMVDGERSDRHPFPGEMLLCRFLDAEGRWQHHQLVMVEPSLMSGIAYRDSAAFDYWCRVIEDCGGALPPLKAEFATQNAPEDYLAYTESYRQLEYDCNLYTLKPDVPINYVSPEIMIPVVLSSFSESNFIPPEVLELMAKQFELIHRQRFEHFFHRRKVTHNIYSQKAMQAFAETGYQTDHFFASRPYTPEERVKILSNLLEAEMGNPYFNVYFAKSDDLIHSTEISCYEGKGTMILSAHTSYNLMTDHAEALITHRGFNEYLRTYFQSELLHNQVLSTAEGRKFLRHLIDVAKDAQ